MELQGKKVLVFGSGKSGIGASDLLAKVGAFPVIYDGNAETDKDAVVHKTDGTYPVTVYAGELPKEVQDSLDLVVLSPGVPTDLPLVKSFYEQGLPVWGEVELAYRVGDGEVLAITGTNGKTTTTALLGKIMQDARESVFVVGNIGTPYTSKALEMKPNSITVAEISSFQLETIDEFAPKVSAILNITEDHLNRHHTMEEYIRVKELITENQGTEDVCVLNYLSIGILRLKIDTCPHDETAIPDILVADHLAVVPVHRIGFVDVDQADLVSDPDPEPTERNIGSARKAHVVTRKPAFFSENRNLLGTDLALPADTDRIIESGVRNQGKAFAQGDGIIDTHRNLQVVHRSTAIVEATDLIPFAYKGQSRPQIERKLPAQPNPIADTHLVTRPRR